MHGILIGMNTSLPHVGHIVHPHDDILLLMALPQGASAMAQTSRTIIRLKGNYFGIPNDIIDKHGRTIGAIGVGVYAALARFADAKTGECWPAIARLERVLGLARSTVKIYLRKLEAAGLIEIEERWAEPGDRTSNLYTLLDCTPATVAKRVAARTASGVDTSSQQPGGRPPDDLPSADTQPTGGLTADPCQLQSEQNQENKEECSRTDEKPAPAPKQPCPHPAAEVYRFDGIILCHHCWSLLPTEATIETTICCGDTVAA
jgi:DNA-binding MarR family transcriptional regulator